MCACLSQFKATRALLPFAYISTSVHIYHTSWIHTVTLYGGIRFPRLDEPLSNGINLLCLPLMPAHCDIFGYYHTVSHLPIPGNTPEHSRGRLIKLASLDTTTPAKQTSLRAGRDMYLYFALLYDRHVTCGKCTQTQNAKPGRAHDIDLLQIENKSHTTIFKSDRIIVVAQVKVPVMCQIPKDGKFVFCIWPICWGNSGQRCQGIIG